MISKHWKSISQIATFSQVGLRTKKYVKPRPSWCMWTNRWPNAHLSTPIVFLIPTLKAGGRPCRPRRAACRHVFIAHLAASIRFVDNLQHLMTWQRWRGEKRYDMWYLSNLFHSWSWSGFVCVKIKVSLLKAKGGDWTKTFKLLYRKQTSLESLSNGWDISSWMFVICSNSPVDTMYILYIHIVWFPQPKREPEKHQREDYHNKLTMIWLPVASMLVATRIVKDV